MRTPQPLRATEDGCTDLLRVGLAQGGRGAQGGTRVQTAWVSQVCLFRLEGSGISTRGPTFPEHSQADVPSAESWLMMTMSRSGAGSFQGFTSFISTPDFINDVGHQPRSYPNLLVSLGIVGFHGDPNFLNKTLKHRVAPGTVSSEET